MKIEEIPIRKSDGAAGAVFCGTALMGRSMEEQQEARERQRMQSYYSRTASDLQRLVEAECDRMDYRGSMMYDEF